MNNPLSFLDLIKLLREFFKGRISSYSVYSERQEIDCILYEAFVFKCGIEEPYNTFKAGIVLDSKYIIADYFGKEISLNNTREDIIKSFELVDKYCQLRLPDKYLEEFFKHKP
ncbi:hypothetical protein GCM10023211_04570 [Orbus sasakiae]|uniref:Uncharacterized protein n=1 Tax=Orbus sasakiae TaxID=1078475 RepID=A0ABP9N233_9GAMM